MNKNAELWCQELEKNELPQTRGSGHNENGYCCLMVAAKLYEEQTGIELPKNKYGYYNANFLDGNFDIVRQWLGLKGSTGKFNKNNSLHNSLARLNDGYCFTFPEIARVIRFEPEGLFIKEE